MKGSAYFWFVKRIEYHCNGQVATKRDLLNSSLIARFPAFDNLRMTNQNEK